VLEGSRHAFLALLTEELKVDDARLLFGVELDPEDHAALHRRPSVAAVLHTRKHYNRHDHSSRPGRAIAAVGSYLCPDNKF